MVFENWHWLAAIIAGHPNHEVVGRTRLQKTVWLLQRLGMPTDYVYSLHFYGPYSEEVKADIGLAQQFGLITETARRTLDGTEYFVLSATRDVTLPEFERFRGFVEQISAEDATVLELAATYDAFRAMHLTHEDALDNLRQMKGDKCASGREKRALDLLRKLNLRDVAA